MLCGIYNSITMWSKKGKDNKDCVCVCVHFYSLTFRSPFLYSHNNERDREKKDERKRFHKIYENEPFNV